MWTSFTLLLSPGISPAGADAGAEGLTVLMGDTVLSVIPLLGAACVADEGL